MVGLRGLGSVWFGRLATVIELWKDHHALLDSPARTVCPTRFVQFLLKRLSKKGQGFLNIHRFSDTLNKEEYFLKSAIVTSKH